MRKFLLTSAILAVMATGASAGTVSTLGSEDSQIIYWGLPDTAAYGQTFTLGSAATVNDVTFRIDDFGASVSYVLNIFAWDGSKTSGSALWSAGGSTSGVAGMTTILTSAGNTLLGAGQFVAFLQATSTGSTAWGSVAGSDAYAGGAFVFQNNGGDQSQWGTVNWSTDWQGPGYDLAFAINYDDVAAVPLPAGLPLLAAGIGGLFALRRRRRA